MDVCGQFGSVANLATLPQKYDILWLKVLSWSAVSLTHPRTLQQVPQPEVGPRADPEERTDQDQEAQGGSDGQQPDRAAPGYVRGASDCRTRVDGALTELSLFTGIGLT